MTISWQRHLLIDEAFETRDPGYGGTQAEGRTRGMDG